MSVTLDHLRRLRTQSGQQDVAALNRQNSKPIRPANHSIEMLRRLLGVRHQIARHTVPVRDRTLPGEEIAPGLRLMTSYVPATPFEVECSLAFANSDQVIDTKHLLFFDTETTGLSGGTGTRAFMIGAADWQGPTLRVRQLLTATMGAERAMLEVFASWLHAESVLCSYNGRCYDAPLLRTRYRLARMIEPISGLSHIDLLFPTRRRYRGVWENCRLATIERNALNIIRDDDLPGSQAPAAWRDYLRGGASTNLCRVREHNRQDVVTLMHLFELLRANDATSPCTPSGVALGGPLKDTVS